MNIESNAAVCTDVAAVNELILRFNGLNQLAFIKCYGVIMIAVSIHCVGYADITHAIIRYGSNGVGVVFFDGVNKLIFIKAYSVFVVTICINSFSNIYITIAIILRGGNGIGIVFFDGVNELIFIKAYGVFVVTVCINSFSNIYITIAIILRGSNGVGIVFFDGVNELIFIKAYSVFVVTVCINSFSNIYITIAIILRGSNSVGVVCLNSFNKLAFVKCYGIVMVAVCIHSVGYADITHAIIRYGSNGIGVLSIVFNEALQSIFINTDYVILIIGISQAIVHCDNRMTGFGSSNSILVIFLNGFLELVFVKAYGIIVVTFIINHFGNIYITIAIILRSSNSVGVNGIFLNGLHELIFIEAYGIIVITIITHTTVNSYIILTVILCSGNGVGVILLNKVTQLVTVDINLIRMIAISAFIGDFQHIGISFYGSNSISPGNAFQLIVYPAAGSNTFYLCLYAALVGIIYLYCQLAIFIQASFHAGISSVGVNGIFLNGLHKLIFIEAYGIIVITIITHTTVNSYIILTVILCSGNGVGVILLNKVTQLVTVDINLIRMIAISAFIGDFQHIGISFYGSNSISPGNAFQLIVYPAAGSNTFYLCLYAALVGIIYLYRQLAIFIQASFHTGIGSVGVNNILQLIVYPALRSNAFYFTFKLPAGIIRNIGSQCAIRKG